MTEIRDIFAREILNNRGIPTLEVEIELDDGSIGRAAIPSGTFETYSRAVELRDNDLSRYLGLGVRNAVNNVNLAVAPRLLGRYAEDQAEIDRLLTEIDDTEDHHIIGSNAIMGVSMAVCRAAAKSMGLPLYRYLGGAGARVLPVPMMQVPAGGPNLEVTEFFIFPQGFKTFSEGFRAAIETRHHFSMLSGKLEAQNYEQNNPTSPSNLNSTENTLDLLLTAIKDAGYKPAEQISLALNANAGDCFDSDSNVYSLPNGDLHWTATELAQHWAELVGKYPIASIEDGMAENDPDGWENLTNTLGSRVQLIGGNLFASNLARIRYGIKRGLANSVSIKLHQVATVTELLDAVRLASVNKYKSIIALSSSETEDPFAADLAVATGVGQIRTGSVNQVDAISKYNRLLRIEEELVESTLYGSNVL